MKPVNMIKVRL